MLKEWKYVDRHYRGKKGKSVFSDLTYKTFGNAAERLLKSLQNGIIYKFIYLFNRESTAKKKH